MKRFLTGCLFLLFFATSIASKTAATPAWFEWAASKTLHFSMNHSKYMNFLNALRVENKFCIFADFDILIGSPSDMYVPTSYGDIDAFPVYGDLGGFIGLADVDKTLGLMVTGSILELTTDKKHLDVVPSSSSTNTVAFRHGDVFFGAYFRYKDDINISAGIRRRQAPLVVTNAENQPVFDVGDDAITMVETSRFYVQGYFWDFGLNTQFGSGALDFVSLLYKLASGSNLFIPKIDYSNITEGLDFSLAWQTMLVPYRLGLGLAANAQIMDNAQFKLDLTWARIDTIWNLYYGEKWSISLVGAGSYINTAMWEKKPGYQAYISVGHRFDIGAALFELGYGQNFIDTVFRMPIEDQGTIIARISVITLF